MDNERDRDHIAEHQERVQHLLVPMVARYRFGEMGETPEGRAVLKAPASLRSSLAIAALAGPRSGRTAALFVEVPGHEQWPADLVSALVRRKIEWDPDSAALALRLVAATDFDDERIQLALKAADQIATIYPSHPEVMEGLHLLDERVQVTPDHRYRVPEMRARVRTSIARHSPPELLDLSPVADSDSWGPPAREVLMEAHRRGVDIVALLRCLTASPSSTAPTARWLAAADEACHSSEARAALRRLVELLVVLDLDELRPFVATGNDDLVRATIWGLGRGALPREDIELLRDAALRCSRTNGKPYVTEALCAKATGAAITVLSWARDAEQASAAPATEALEELWADLARADLLKRVGAVLGRTPEQISTRLEKLKRTKADAKRRQINPDPEGRKVLLRDVITEDVARRFEVLGFDDHSRQTFRRHHPYRTEVASLSVANAEVRLFFGVRFTPPGEVRADHSSLGIDDLDVAVELALVTSVPEAGDEDVPSLGHLATMYQDKANRRAQRGSTDPLETLLQLMDRFASVGLPTLDRWADPKALADDLEYLDVPFRHGTLLLGLDRTNGRERRSIVRRLRAMR